MSEPQFFDREAEEAVIKTCLRHPEAPGDAVEMGLKAAQFSEANGLIFAAVLDLAEAPKPMSVDALVRHLAAADKLTAIGGRTAIDDIWRNAEEGLVFYGTAVIERAAVRREFSLLQAHMAQLSTPGVDVSREMAAFRSALLSEDATEIRTAGPRSVGEIMADEGYPRLSEWTKNPKAIQGIRTGVPPLDRLLGGLVAGRMSVVGATTSAGKTQWMQYLARLAAIGGSPTLLLSTEMGAMDNMFRWAFMEAGMDKLKAEDQGMRDDQKRQFLDSALVLATRPIYVWETGGLDLARIRVAVRRMRARYGIKLVLLDMMNGLEVPTAKGENFAQSLGKLMAGLHSLAVGEDIHLMATAHVNRAASQKGEYLGLHDFRDSASVEQWADQAMMVMPVDAHGQVISITEANKDSRELGFVRLIANVCKNRFGALGMVPMTLNWDAGGKFTEPGEAA